MSDRPTVLVTGVGACGVGEGLVKAVRLADRYRLLVVNDSLNAPVLFESDPAYLVPSAGAPEYVEVMLDLCRVHGVDVLLPGSEPELVVLAGRVADFARIGTRVMCNPEPVVKAFQDKWLTFLALDEAGVPTPRTRLLAEGPGPLTYPLVVKPRFGHGSHDVFVASSQAEAVALGTYLGSRGIEAVAQELVEGDEHEYTVSVLIGDEEQVLGSIAMRRRLLGGFTQWVEIEDFPEVRAQAERTALAVGARGPLNIQCRLRDGDCWVFEINPRFSGSAPFRALVGFNEPDILIRHHLSGEVPAAVRPRVGLVGMRSLEELVVEGDVLRSVPRASAPAP